MNDAALARLGREWKRLDAEAKKAKADADRIKDRILREMERRDTRGIVTGGVKITYVQQKPIVYDPDKLRRSLGRETYLRSCTKRVFDKDAMLAAVQEGLIDLAKVERASHEEPKAPYINVDLSDE